ncbi:Tetratrico peptide repeat group 5 domain-containing protein OS=Tsukamurella paurometabola (strain ATCC 8368 / DSM / CCUG 35730 / CIP 100753 / JCM 10117/ KCTC 9821 / NBRC 16120 / NCIMB 702349 / NCTC 13040) OX=521096 GN=Tpau_3883 PE=4 SV=1 [Tsukamurella paurometabola]|uniref:Tetratrico peptide repeat group 5 domain-containing protein n=1 Tax=Tsukamurella paurometabola (strain ATCC 8368 / DSM 20162 / CCUG 35730 / CIP 100753 / JCM 10117 / KCTC 9821 / NBRC 16120 / NCIMB 702349 / NCTC 13040) TaxID=521096 RepID=D5UMI2_TSUPD|nr:tetratricopeptide repeat protein [Tsukamurella paurometabola]ADG80456.1 conserved hypothetical protein [Tsukamurella paurometabola DSM 20162]SUP39710.1 Tetratrico peptide repeat [Tsukamurella paurometabola]
MTWEDDLEAAWAADLGDAELRARIDRIVSDPSVPAGVAAFERAGVEDSTGHPDRAVPGYRRALDAGLDDSRARQATIQLASSLRNLGEAADGLALLNGLATDRGDGLDGAIAVFRALCLADLQRPNEAIAMLIDSVAEGMTRYRRSAQAYADELRTR